MSRLMVMQKAGVEVATAVNKVTKEYDLSYNELFCILTDVMKSWIGYGLRDEKGERDTREKKGINFYDGQPTWAEVVIKSNKSEIERFAAYSKDGYLVGGYKTGDDDFTVRYDEDVWKVVTVLKRGKK